MKLRRTWVCLMWVCCPLSVAACADGAASEDLVVDEVRSVPEVEIAFTPIGALPEPVEASHPKETGEASDLVPDWCVGGPNKSASWKIYYGTTQPSHVPLTAGQTLAIGTFGWCTGTLIAPDWVLSASHCDLSPGDWFCMGHHPADPDVCIEVVDVHDNPWADQTVVRLATDARERLEDVEPIPLMSEDLDMSWIGRTVEAAGYGAQETGASGVREFTAEPVSGLSHYMVSIDGEGKHGACFGDSGGPVMVVQSDGTVRVAGDLAEGDESCVGIDYYTRVDVFRDWLAETMGGLYTVGAQPCGEVSLKGRCDNDGSRATWCGPDGVIVTDLCGDDETCSWHAEAEGWRCLATSEDPCEGVGAAGRCDGEVLSWCGPGGLLQRDCAACSEVCVPHPSAGFVCVPSQCEPGLGFKGRCDGDVVTWCDRDGEPRSLDCDEYGQTCGWLDASTGMYCVDEEAPDPCEGLDYLGTCDGTVSRWCQDGQPTFYDCADVGQACGWHDDATGYACIADCGGLDYAGECDGAVARWCEDGEVHSFDCASEGEVCGWADDAVGYTCLSACGDVDYFGLCDGDTVQWCDGGQITTLDCGQHAQSCGWLGDEWGHYCVD